MMKNKYNIGDLIIETCFKYRKDNRLGYISDISKYDLSKYKNVIYITWFDNPVNKDFYTEEIIDSWITKNNAKHYPVKE
jgi:hypothetical protein